MTTTTAKMNSAAGTDLVRLATELADEFRERAAGYDLAGEFPHTNYDRMRDTGYLAALVPVELGGLGVGLREMMRGQEALARGCASTALAVNMHHFQVGAMADGWRSGAPTGPLLERIVQEGLVLGSTAAEAVVAGEWTTPTEAVPVDGGYRVTGRKYFASQAPRMDIARVNVRHAETGEILVVAVPMSAEGVSVDETWDTMGMRATGSHDMVMDDVFVSDAAVGITLPSDSPTRAPGFAGVATWFLTLMSSVCQGIAVEARELALSVAAGTSPSNFRNQALTDVLLGELEVSVETGRSTLEAIGGELDANRTDPQRALTRALVLKEIVVPSAVASVGKAVQVSGGRSFFRKSPLEWLARDVQAGLFHPPSAPVSFQMLGERVRESRA